MRNYLEFEVESEYVIEWEWAEENPRWIWDWVWTWDKSERFIMNPNLRLKVKSTIDLSENGEDGDNVKQEWEQEWYVKSECHLGLLREYLHK